MLRPRTRRTLDVGEHPSGREQVARLAEQFHAANKAKNAASSDERRLQKELDKVMAKVGAGAAWGMDHEFTDADGFTRKVVVKYGGTMREIMDVGKLFTKVTQEVFLKIVSASKANVERHAGKNTMNQCLTTAQSDFKASVKESK